MPDLASAVVFGGSGFIGRHLTERLSRDGVPVVVADLQSPAWPLPAGVSYVPTDVREPIRLTTRPAPVVFNLAAVHRTPGHPDHEYYDTNVAGALNVTAWAERAGSTDVVFTSSISVYGAGEQRKDESSPLTPDTAYGRSKALAEQVHRRWAAADGRHLVVARPAVVFGPGERGNVTRLADALERRVFVYPGRDDTVKACGWVGDLVRALLFGLDQPRAEYLFNSCYPQATTIRDICEAFERVAGLPAPRKVPAPVVDALVRTLRRVPGSDRSGVLNPERVRKVTTSTDIAPAALAASGFRWETDLDSALRAWQQAEPYGRFV